MATPEQKELRRNLVSALRSDKYEQTSHVLRERVKTGFKYCCLGVACDLIPNFDWDKCFGYVVLPKDVADLYGFTTNNGGFGNTCLSQMNDAGKTFAEIADIIESEPKGLFNG